MILYGILGTRLGGDDSWIKGFGLASRGSGMVTGYEGCFIYFFWKLILDHKGMRGKG